MQWSSSRMWNDSLVSSLVEAWLITVRSFRVVVFFHLIRSYNKWDFGGSLGSLCAKRRFLFADWNLCHEVQWMPSGSFWKTDEIKIQGWKYSLIILIIQLRINLLPLKSPNQPNALGPTLILCYMSASHTEIIHKKVDTRQRWTLAQQNRYFMATVSLNDEGQ